MDDRSRLIASRLLAVLGFLVGFVAWLLSVKVYLDNRLLRFDEQQSCQDLTGVLSAQSVGSLFAPQSTCVWNGGAIELVARGQIAPVTIMWAVTLLVLVASLVVRGLPTVASANLSLMVFPLLLAAAVFTGTTGVAWLGPVAVYEAPVTRPAQPYEPTWEERDGWSFVIPVPSSTEHGSYAENLAAIGPLVDETLEAVGPIPHPWDPEHEPTFPTLPVPCAGTAERPVFEASFTAADNAGAVGRARELWQGLGYTVDERSTASHVVAFDPLPETGVVLSIEHYDKLLRVQVSGLCGG